MSFTDTVLNNPETLAILTALVVAAWHFQHGLTYREYRLIHDTKTLLAPIVDRHTDLFVLSRKGYREDPEYLFTVEGTVRDTYRTLVDAGARPHLINSVKTRRVPLTGQQYSKAHVVWRHADGDRDGNPEQTEVYVFDNNNGTVDIYSHHEGWVGGPRDHLTGGQRDGDPSGVLRGVFANEL